MKQAMETSNGTSNDTTRVCRNYEHTSKDIFVQIGCRVSQVFVSACPLELRALKAIFMFPQSSAMAARRGP